MPSCYVVSWDGLNVVKAGYSEVGRWRLFQRRGARLMYLWPCATSHEAFGLESIADMILHEIGFYAFESKGDAEPYLGKRGAGWCECYCVDVEMAEEMLKMVPELMADA